MNSSFTTPVLNTPTTYYVSIDNGTCESIRRQVVAQIDMIGAAPTTISSSNCGAASLILLNASGGTNGEYRWYTVATNGTAIANETNSSYTTPSLSSTTTYFVAINDGTCESPRTPVIATINTLPVVPSATGASSCGAGSLILNASGTSNGQYRWYSGGAIITGEINSSYTTPSLSSSVTYFVSINDGTCESAKTPITATINSAPTAPTTNGASGCAPTSLTVTASGGTNGQYRWYTSATGGTAISGETNSSYLTPLLSNTNSYYVSIHDGTCESSRTTVVADIVSCPNNQPPVILTASLSVEVNGEVSIDLLSLVSDPDNNIDLTKLIIISPPQSGAIATIDSNQKLIIDYSNTDFTGTDELIIEVCDLAGSCVQQKITVEVEGDIIAYNGISPNGDSQNPIFEIKNIDLMEDTKNNHVSIYNRWGSKVFEAENYNNTTRVFTGLNENGNDLPSGTYFYKIEFSSGRETQTGYITLKR